MTLIIAEIGQNHCGNIDNLIKLAWQADTHADIVKFQCWNYDNIYRRNDARYASAITRKLLIEDIVEVAKTCKKPVMFSFFGIDPSRSDLFKRTKLKNTSFLKVAACQNAKELYPNQYTPFVSIDINKPNSDMKNQNIHYLSCISEYPTIDAGPALRWMVNKQQQGHSVGYSDHTIGLDAAKAAIQLDAYCVEKHFTLQELRENHPFRDHQCSMIEADLIELVEFRDKLMAGKDKNFTDLDAEGFRRLKTK